MKLSGYLATAKTFGRLLDQLASPTPDAELLGDVALAIHPALRAFSARKWAADRRRTATDGAQDLVLLVAYQTTLHIEQVRYRCPPRVLRGWPSARGTFQCPLKPHLAHGGWDARGSASRTRRAEPGKT
jgi:hypothetical protein